MFGKETNIKNKFDNKMPKYMKPIYDLYSQWHDDLTFKLRNLGDKFGIDTSTDDISYIYYNLKQLKFKDEDEMFEPLQTLFIRLKNMDYDFYEVWDAIIEYHNIMNPRYLSTRPKTVEQLFETRFETPF